MSKILLPVPPEGEGTEDCEALYSYMIRLASEHVVSLRYLFDRLIASEVPSAGKVIASLKGTDLCVVTRPNHTTERVIEALGAVGYVDQQRLARMTFLPLDPVLRRGQEMFDYGVKWCSGCLGEQAEAGRPIYHKLVWNFVAVTSCIRHKLELRRTCPHCGAKPRPWTSWRDLGECQFCRGRLDSPTSSDVVLHDVVFMAKDLVDLVGFLTQSEEALPEGGPYTYLHAIDAIGQAVGREGAWRPTSSELQELGTLYWRRPSLLSVRRLAFRLNVPIGDVLRGVPLVQSLPFEEDDYLPLSLLPKGRDRSLDPEALQQKFVALAEASDAPLRSVRSIAERLDVSPGALNYHCPELVKQHVARIAARRVELGAERAEKAQKAVHKWLEAAGEIDRDSVPLRPLRDVLYAAGGFTKRELEAALRAVFQSADEERERPRDAGT